MCQMNVKERSISQEIVLQSFLMQPNYIAIISYMTFSRTANPEDAESLVFFLFFCFS